MNGRRDGGANQRASDRLPPGRALVSMEKYELRYLVKSEIKREWLPTREALVERLQQLAQTEKRILGTWKVSEKNGILTSESLDIQVFGKFVVIK